MIATLCVAIAWLSSDLPTAALTEVADSDGLVFQVQGDSTASLFRSNTALCKIHTSQRIVGAKTRRLGGVVQIALCEVNGRLELWTVCLNKGADGAPRMLWASTPFPRLIHKRLRFTQNGAYLCVSNLTSFFIIRSSDGERVSSLVHPRGLIDEVVPSPVANCVFLKCDQDGQSIILEYDIATGESKQVARYTCHKGSGPMVVSKDGSRLYATDNGRNITCIRLTDGRGTHVGEALATVCLMDMDERNQRIVTYDLQGNLALWSLNNGKCMGSLFLPQAFVASLAICSDKSSVVIANHYDPEVIEIPFDDIVLKGMTEQ